MLKELPGLPDGVRGLEAVGTVTAADYAGVLAPMVDHAGRTGERLRLLYMFGPGFRRITLGALWADARLGISHLRLLDGCAVVSDIGWIRSPSRAIGARLPFPIRVYDNDNRDDAVAWLTALPPGHAVSSLAVATAYVGGIAAGIAGLPGLFVKSRGPADRPRRG
ncbi:STAS/SEC14 domain-containing protein [Mycobacterium sherrisii]|uniref:STAS/SEC14 domain-containing protein n=1 Tax=Mycobacterium sherrisii TaxID=243061 RepID=UPI003974EE88